jgi:hypothetical protein
VQGRAGAARFHQRSNNGKGKGLVASTCRVQQSNDQLASHLIEDVVLCCCTYGGKHKTPSPRQFRQRALPEPSQVGHKQSRCTVGAFKGVQLSTSLPV